MESHHESMNESTVRSLTPFVRQATERKTLTWLDGAKVQVLVDSAASAGRLSVVAIQAEDGYVAAPHLHSVEDEIFYVIHGAMTVRIGNVRQDLQAGSVALLPKYIWHEFRVTANDSRFLNICVPGGLDGFFQDVSHELGAPTVATPTWISELVRRTGMRYGLTYK